MLVFNLKMYIINLCYIRGFLSWIYVGTHDIIQVHLLYWRYGLESERIKQGHARGNCCQFILHWMFFYAIWLLPVFEPILLFPTSKEMYDDDVWSASTTVLESASFKDWSLFSETKKAGNVNLEFETEIPIFAKAITANIKQRWSRIYELEVINVFERKWRREEYMSGAVELIRSWLPQC